jgi:aspartate aminotransferase
MNPSSFDSMALAKRVQRVSPSLTLAIAAKSKELKKQGVDVLSFSAGEPDFDTPAVIKKAAIQALEQGLTKYTPATGNPDLKKAISEKLNLENSLSYAPDQIVVTCGAKHALYNVFQVLIEEGDEVIIPSPYWLSYPEMVTLAGGIPAILKTDIQNGFQYSVESIEKLITAKTKAFVLNSPSNPAGNVISKEVMEGIVKLAKKHSFYIVSDEIYEKIIFDGLSHISIGALDPGILNQTITVGGASKCFAMTGWRLGFLAASKPIVKACSALQSHSTSNPTSFAQPAYLYALQYAAKEVKAMCQSFEKRRNLICKLLDDMPKVRAFRPSGAFYVFVDISQTGLSSIDFADKLLSEAKVSVVPGISFGHDDAVRMSFAASEETIKVGCARIHEWLKKI